MKVRTTSVARKARELWRDSDAEALKVVAACVRQNRARRGMTRKTLANDSGVSERYLAQIEAGKGNISILVLRRIARALDVPLNILTTDGNEPSVELEYLFESLRRRSIDELKRVRHLLASQFSDTPSAIRHQRIALIGMRGAGKSTLGKMLAEKLEMPFVELDREIEKESGLSLNLIFDFHGQAGFRRLERRCLEKLIDSHTRFVVATGGSLVSEPTTFQRLLSECFAIWLRTSPKEHMERVIAQGDLRPMASSREAMVDLQSILKGREPLYSRADFTVDTRGQTPAESLAILIQELESAFEK